MSTWSSWDVVASDVGRLCAVARRLHAILGSAAVICPTPGIAVLFDEWSLHMAAQATPLYEHLPLRAGFDRDAVIEAGAYDQTLRMLEALEPAQQEMTLFFGTVSVVIPTLRRDVAAVHQRTSDVAERSLRRTLTFLEIDLETAWLQGDERLSALALDPEVKRQLNDVRSAVPAISLD